MTERADSASDAAAAGSVLLGELHGVFRAGALRAVAVHRIADHLAEGALHPEELGRRSGMHGPSLRRVLRLLASRGIFREDEQGRFHLTSAAELLRAEAPGSQLDLVLLLTDGLFWNSTARLDEVIRSGKPVFEAIFGSPFFEYLAERPEAQMLFDRGMASLATVNDSVIAEAYGFSGGTVIADIGGGRGGLLRSVLERHSTLRGILFDKEQVVKEHVLDTSALAGRWRIESGDFFVSVPAGATFYILKQILHDWSDDDCLRILRSCQRAMNADSRLLVVDTVLPSGNDPHPAKAVDIIMMSMLGGKERSAAEFTELLAEAGFTVIRVLATQSSTSIIEARRRLR
jgi:hypothetical protein